jgi:hypothetical protein
VAVAVAFLCGLVFLFRWRAAWMAALLWIPLMSISHMYLGRHFLGDVVGGLAAGVVATMVVVRALNLQRLGGTGDRRVLLKTIATAAACVAVAYLAAVLPVYEAGRLTGAVLALVLVGSAPVGYAEASPATRVARLALAIVCSGAVWWASVAALRPSVGEPSATQAFFIGGIRMVVLRPVPVLLERMLRLKRVRAGAPARWTIR